jgi:hypothetical protein
MMVVAVWILAALAWGCIGGVMLAERRHREAIRFYAEQKAATKNVIETQRCVGGGISVKNIGHWHHGTNLVRVTLEPMQPTESCSRDTGRGEK